MKRDDALLKKVRFKRWIEDIKRTIKSVPILGQVVNFIMQFVRKKEKIYPGGPVFWEDHYANYGNSGPGSHGKSAISKSRFMNQFVDEHNIESVIEFGCGDGNQLKQGKYKKYIGLDISESAIKICSTVHKGDAAKKFKHYEPHNFQLGNPELKSELGLSQDVIYHIMEDELFELYVRHLFSVSEKFVVIFGADEDGEFDNTSMVRHRNFTKWIRENISGWSLVRSVSPEEQYHSLYSFFVYQKKEN